MNKVVNFELAKLLKEKEYPQFVEHLGVFVPNTPKCYADSFGNLYDRSDWEDYPEFYLKEISAPTIAEVVMWLYEKHRIWISVYEYKDHAADVNDDYMFRTSHTKLREFNSPTEAYEAAIDYTLNRLI